MTGHGNKSPVFRKIITRVLVLFAAVVVGLLLSEVIIRIFHFEWRFIQKALPYMDKELETHVADPDPRIVVGLKPNSVGEYMQHFGPFKVTVNSLGFRGPERSVKKPPGVFRIVCVGGSNVYGAGLNDDKTWPAQLESQLNARSSGKYEVWNLGVSGYNNIQMVAVSEKAMERYDPDLIIFALSNFGPRFFKLGTPNIEEYFEKDPTLWLELFPPYYFDFPTFLSQEKKLRLLGHVALYRFAMTARLAAGSEERFISSPVKSPHYIETTRTFLRTAGRRTGVVVFICPAVMPKNFFEPHYRGLDVSVFILEADNKPQEYREYHPPDYVMTWYAENLIRWLHQNNLLPKDDPAP